MKRLIILAILAMTSAANAETYYCPATAKYDAAPAPSESNVQRFEYSAEYLAKWKFAVRFDWNKNGISYLSRCSYTASVDAVTCDRYEVDQVDVSRPVSPIVKAYVFRSQYNFQLFVESMTYIEDNGRGSIQYGSCTKI